MDEVLCLIADPARRLLDPRMASEATRALTAAGAAVGRTDWLAQNAALELRFGGLPRDTAVALVREALGDAPVDIAAVPAIGRVKRLLLADMDATIVEGETLDEIAALAGIAEQVAPITRAAMNGEIDFAEALRRRVALLAGQSQTLLERVAAAIRPMPGARALVDTMRRHGSVCILVSGGFTVFTRHVGGLLGFDLAEGNELLVERGRLTGRVAEPILGRERKVALLRERAARLGLRIDQTMAVGDGANDVPMLTAAGLGVGFRPKPVVRRAVAVAIDHGDLTALLYLQGYRETQILGEGG